MLGNKREMTKPEAKRALLDLIAKETSVPCPVELAPCLTFGTVADAWELKRLPQLKVSTQYSAPLLLNKYLRKHFGPMALESIKTGVVNDWIRTLSDKHPKNCP